MKRTTALLATLLTLVVVALPSVASAASLNVRGAVVTVVAAKRCDDALEVRPDARQGLVGSGYTTAFEVRDVAAACAGRALEVVVFSATGARLGSGQLALADQFAGGTVYLTLTPVDARGVFLPDVLGGAATVGTWAIPARWVLPGTTLPLVLCRTEAGAACAPSVSAITSPATGTWRFQIQAQGFLQGDRLYINLARVGTGMLPFRAQTVDVDGGGWFIFPPAVVEEWRCAASSLLVYTPGGYNVNPVVITGFTNNSGDEPVPSCA